MCPVFKILFSDLSYNQSGCKKCFMHNGITADLKVMIDRHHDPTYMYTCMLYKVMTKLQLLRFHVCGIQKLIPFNQTGFHQI